MDEYKFFLYSFAFAWCTILGALWDSTRLSITAGFFAVPVVLYWSKLKGDTNGH